MKKMFTIFAMFIILLVSTSPSFAHDLSEGGGETWGWKYVGAHWPSTTTTYFEATSDTWESRFKNGEAKFESETGYRFSLIERTSADTSNFIESYSCSSCTWVARRTFISISADHPTRWRIQFNSAKSANSWTTVAAHEIGHVYGLADLYQSYNDERLMYGYDNGTRYLDVLEKDGLDYVYNVY